MADISITASQVVPSSDARTSTGTAGAAITAGQPVYKDSSTNKFHPALNDTEAHAEVKGIAVNGAAADQPFTYVIRDSALDLGAGAGLTVASKVLLLSGTAGGITITPADVTTGDFVVILGVANSDGSINCNFEAGAMKSDAAISA